MSHACARLCEISGEDIKKNSLTLREPPREFFFEFFLPSSGTKWVQPSAAPDRGGWRRGRPILKGTKTDLGRNKDRSRKDKRPIVREHHISVFTSTQGAPPLHNIENRGFLARVPPGCPRGCVKNQISLFLHPHRVPPRVPPALSKSYKFTIKTRGHPDYLPWE